MEEAKERIEKLNNELMQLGPIRQLSEATGLPAGMFVMITVFIAVVLCAFQLPFCGIIV